MQTEEFDRVKKLIPQAKEYFDAKIKYLTKNKNELSKKLKEYKWTEETGQKAFAIVKSLIDIETFEISKEFLTNNLELEMVLCTFKPIKNTSRTSLRSSKKNGTN